MPKWRRKTIRTVGHKGLKGTILEIKFVYPILLHSTALYLIETH